MKRINVGDIVTWNGGPNELSCWRKGTVIGIHKGIAKVTKDYSDDIRFVPLKILKKDE